MATQQLNALKTINNIQRDGSLQDLLLSIKQTKVEMDSFAKTLQEQKAKLVAKQKEAERKQAELEKAKMVSEEEPVVSAPVEQKTERVFAQGNNQKNNFRKFEPREQRFQPRNNAQGQGGQNNQRPPFNRNQNFNNRNGQTQQGAQGNRPKNNSFVSTKANNFKSFAPTESSSVLAQPERNFGNKNKQRRNIDETKKLSAKQKSTFSKQNNILVMDEEGVEETTMGSRKLIKKKKETNVVIAPQITHAVISSNEITVKDLSEKIGKPVAEIVKKLMLLGVMATINSSIDFDTCELVAGELGVSLELKLDKTYEEKLLDASNESDDEKDLVKRPPVVTVMGHVDHGKTSLLDAFRKTNVVSGEAGGITQKIGAYQISFNGEKITFIDTPGHAAFTSMRARGAEVTDIAILVVAADDGIMPQTIEAISHIKAANVPMIVAINKIDKPEANIDRVKQQLAEHNVLPEEWGGDAICVPVSAKTGMGMDDLKKMILLVAEMEELKANPNKTATGSVIEAELDKTRGAVATVLVQNGTLKIGDSIICGITYGKVKAMFDENGKPLKKAGPSTPVAVMGFNEVPNSGDAVYVVDESLSKQVINERINKIKQERARLTSGVSADDFMSRVHEGKLKNLNIIIKADTQGSVEALKASLEAIRNEEVKVVCIHSAAGAITESDIILAQTTGAVVVAFNIKIPNKTTQTAESLKVEIIESKIIYELVDQITRLSKGMMSIKYEEKYIGSAEIRMVFKLSSAGKVAGSYVLDGKIARNGVVKVKRKDEVVGESSVESLKIVKDEKSEVAKGFECGIKLRDNIDFVEGDIIECYIKQEVKRD
ncbi:MAG: translation initiation factor IF-2 [Clostridiales bacterium]|nr:translation initiation factor IF-2 [Clostridiales bacterium]